MLLTFSLEERLDPIGQDEDPVGPVPRAPPSWPLATTLRTVASALRDGLLALRRYEHLRSRGVADDLALRMAIGVPHASSDIRPAARRHVSGSHARRPRHSLAHRRGTDRYAVSGSRHRHCQLRSSCCQASRP